MKNQNDRSESSAKWLHDVAIVRKAPALFLTVPFGIKGVEGLPQEANPEVVKGFDDHPILVRVRLDDESIIQVASMEHPEFAAQQFQESTGLIRLT